TACYEFMDVDPSRPPLPGRASESNPLMDIFRPQIWKIVVLYVAATAGMIVPTAVAMALAFCGPPPYLLIEEGLGSAWAQPGPHTFPDGSSVMVHAHPDGAAARQGADAVLKAVPRNSTEMAPGLTRYTRRDDGRRGLVMALGGRVIHIEAEDDGAVNA